MEPSYDFFHLRDGPSMRVPARRSEFQVGQAVVVPNPVFMVDRESLVAKPQNRIATHRVLLVQREPVFSLAISFGHRMPSHSQDSNVTPRRFSRMANAVFESVS